MGYQTNVDTRLPGSTDIEAIQNGRKILVQVKAAVLPSAPAPLSSEEERNIRHRATYIGGEPWEAKVQLDAIVACGRQDRVAQSCMRSKERQGEFTGISISSICRHSATIFYEHHAYAIYLWLLSTNRQSYPGCGDLLLLKV